MNYFLYLCLNNNYELFSYLYQRINKFFMTTSALFSYRFIDIFYTEAPILGEDSARVRSFFKLRCCPANLRDTVVPVRYPHAKVRGTVVPIRYLHATCREHSYRYDAAKQIQNILSNVGNRNTKNLKP